MNGITWDTELEIDMLGIMQFALGHDRIAEHHTHVFRGARGYPVPSAELEVTLEGYAEPEQRQTWDAPHIHAVAEIEYYTDLDADIQQFIENNLTASTKNDPDLIEIVRDWCRTLAKIYLLTGQATRDYRLEGEE